MTAGDLWRPGTPTVGRRATVWTEEAGRGAVYTRSAGGCEFGCGRPGTSFSHRKGRGRGGQWSPVNGMHACGDGTTGCHGVITREPALAEAGGWAVSAYVDPEAAPVWLSTPEGAGWVWLTEAGDGYRHRHRFLDRDDVAALGLPVSPLKPWEYLMSLGCRPCDPDAPRDRGERCTCLRHCGAPLTICTGTPWGPGEAGAFGRLIGRAEQWAARTAGG